MIFTVKL
ncbi:capsular polysaccharide biosynthesis domain protein, partial [Vibrio parahaemolyticus EKP-021]